MVRRNEDPGFVKIGITRKVADDRFGYFSSCCGFEPIPLRQIRDVPCLRRVERLVHADIVSYRRECTTCVDRADCGALHSEWFEIAEDLALAVMEKWTRWMFTSDPYDSEGQLKDICTQSHTDLKGYARKPASEQITSGFNAQDVRDDALVCLFSSMSIASSLRTAT